MASFFHHRNLSVLLKASLDLTLRRSTVGFVKAVFVSGTWQGHLKNAMASRDMRCIRQGPDDLSIPPAMLESKAST